MATKSSKIHVYIFMILIFFLCLLSFSVGTFVGKSVTESEMRKAQGEMATNLSKERDLASAESTELTESEEDELALTGDEIDNLAKEFSQEDGSKASGDDPNIEAELASAASEKSEKMNQNKTGKSPITDVTNRIAESQPATKALKKPRQPSTVIPAVAASSLGKFTVQIASYTNEKEATTHAAKLKKKGYSAFYLPAVIRGKEWYRVSVGLFENSSKANNFRKSFIKRTQLESAIVQQIKAVK